MLPEIRLQKVSRDDLNRVRDWNRKSNAINGWLGHYTINGVLDIGYDSEKVLSLSDLDLNSLLVKAVSKNPVYNTVVKRNEVLDTLDANIIKDLKSNLHKKNTFSLKYNIKNTDRAVGARLSSFLISNLTTSIGACFLGNLILILLLFLNSKSEFKVLFMPTIWYSYSKSATALKPRNTILASTSAAKSARRLPNEDTLTLLSWRFLTSLSTILTLSVISKNGSFL